MMTRQNQNVVLLALCQALMMTANSLLITTSALIGLAIAPAPEYATIPLGFQFLAMTTVAMPASLLMRRIGRQKAFLLATLIAITGALISSWAIRNGSFWYFSLGVICLGIFNGFGQFYRFAAADVASADFKNKAISLVLAGGIVAAFAGPNLAAWSRNWVGGSEFLGSYLSLLGLYAVTILALIFLKIPKERSEDIHGSSRSLSIIIRQPRFIIAALSAMVGYGVMNVIMTATPLDMQHKGFSFNDTAFVIQWHVLGMFAPSFFTGSLINRFGVIRIIRTGVIALVLCAILNVLMSTHFSYWLALTLLGIGWNFMFVGGTTLLTETYAISEKAKTQGCNDFLVFFVVTLTALSSGYLHFQFGWRVINYAALPFLLLVFVLSFWYSRKQH